MKYAILLLSIAFSIFYTMSLILAPQLGLPGQLNYSPVSLEEIHALEWIWENREGFEWTDMLCDYFCKEYAALVFFELKLHQASDLELASDWNKAVVTGEIFWDKHRIVYEMTVAGVNVSDEGFKFALYSERQAEKGIFRLWSENGRRRQYVASPMLDVWENNPAWKLVYEKDGVRVYERN